MPQDLSGAQVGMAPQNNVNNPRPENLRGRNLFPQSHQHLTTDRYGEYNPFFWAKCERGDIFNVGSHHDLHTFTLASPMLANVSLHKSFIKVPLEAIYPRTYEKQITIPTQGDDVPSDVRALLDVTTLVKSSLDVLKSADFDTPERLRAFILLELLCSHGSLFERFNMHFNFKFSFKQSDIVSFDEISDDFWSKVVDYGFPLINDQDQFVYVRTSLDQVSDGTQMFVSPRRFVEMIRSLEYSYSDEWESLFDDDLEGLVDSIVYFSGYDSSLYRDSLDPYQNYINIEPIIAYQLACAQFGTNDHVDFLYSAKLYRDNLFSISSTVITDFTGLPYPTFIYNGVNYQYDVFSLKIFDNLIVSIQAGYFDAFDFFINLFSYVPSLRYGDYFTGVKPQPLAVGEYSAKVNSGEVSAIDITRSIQMQRLLNRVNMVGRKLGDYLSGIFGGKLPEAPKDVPVFLSHQIFDLKGFETNNTGSDQLDPTVQNTITSHLRSAESRHSFDIEISEPCYVIGMNYYETMRIYSKTIDRFCFHHDRYDDFIPEMQYIGDQDVRLTELTGDSRDLAFGYNLRYMEYKQRYSYASGGFINRLPSWSFITDNIDGNPAELAINPQYIRSSPSEFDRFYKSITGYSLASYWHFIVCHTNIVNPYRMMEYAPEILK